ncbi:hypothetical protein [Butyrivibrio sp. XPD2006]|uniref:hypothetical protein n=1 Tax=Butyrivibrio sp. XPD2006 TaxID=1280668 RepID=UPI0003B47B83|nr:hypothetical protein [Butyrivibrio sp. XPD2006]
MRFDDVSVITALYNAFLNAKSDKTDFEEIDIESSVLEDLILSHINTCDGTVKDEIRAKILDFGIMCEKQGFIYGFSMGLALSEQAKFLNERK